MEPPPLTPGNPTLRAFGLALAVCFGPLLVIGVLGTLADAAHNDGLATFTFALLGLSLLADAGLFVYALARVSNGTPGAWGLLGGVVLFGTLATGYLLNQMGII